ncbi:hypothetical protein [Streptomyces yangpuensis]|uniref:hypothetical protein n=1 Tax=Streptomyces yangpuensis TaxID=1648182 RepID=UPI003659E4E1
MRPPANPFQPPVPAVSGPVADYDDEHLSVVGHAAVRLLPELAAHLTELVVRWRHCA